jgi:hypothetical protein
MPVVQNIRQVIVDRRGMDFSDNCSGRRIESEDFFRAGFK